MQPLLGRYRIDARLGEGGMGVVWRAHDLQLGRDVALKVLPDSRVADADSRARLLREARAAAALGHPNIVTVYDVGEADGHVFIAMEFVPGRTLSEVIGHDGVPVVEAVRLGVQIAAALAHAHERGVVHRDVKPSNVIVTPSGVARVLDFGIATWVVSDHSDTVTVGLTQAGSLVGTPGAMAPEQWRGERADPRTDVWAFGVLMYTLLTGAPPFQGRTTYELATAISTSEPPVLPARVPPALRALVTRCLEREPERRFRSASELHAALEMIAAGTSPVAAEPVPPASERHGGRLRPAAVAVGVAVAVIAALVALFVALRGGGRGAAGRPITSLAVLPLDNFSHDAGQQYFVDGMTEELTTRLAQLGVVRVISRTSVMRYRGTTLALPVIAKQLGVDAIVEGSVEQAGGRMRITAQLVRAATDEHLWARSYEREVGDALALQDEVAGAIAREVRGTLASGPQMPRSATRHSAPRAAVAAEAVQAYLRGRDQYQKWTDDGVRRALEYYDRALAIAPTFAAAMAARASALLWVSNAPDTVSLARTAIAKALALAPDLGEAHAAHAKSLFENDWNWAESEREFRRAIALNPNDADAHHHYSHLLVALGRVDEAREQARIMLTLDPLSAASHNHLGWLAYECGDFDQAVAECNKAVELDPTYASAYMQIADVALATRRWTAVRDAFERASRLGDGVDPLRFRLVAAAEHGRGDEGERILREMLDARDPFKIDWGEVAAWDVAFGNRERAFASLDSAFAARSYRVMFANLDPEFAPLRGDPRYTALRRRMRLPA